MADEKQLEMLQNNTNFWNQWRNENFLTEIDLSNANLDNKELAYLDFSNANLKNVSLINSDLTGSDFFESNFTQSNLYNANLQNAILTATNFTLTNLNKTNMKQAIIWTTNFNNTFLNSTNFELASLDTPSFNFVDLSLILNLDKVEHHGPSAIDISTIYKSKGDIPIEFLKGAGVDDHMIEYIQSIKGAIQFYSCFISYSSKDIEFAKQLHDKLQGIGIRCWLDREDLKTGDYFKKSINEAIRVHDKLLLILSENSVNSEWVETEVDRALEKEKQTGKLVLFPVRIDDAAMDEDELWISSLRNKRHITDFSNWKNHDDFENAFERIVRDLKSDQKN